MSEGEGDNGVTLYMSVCADSDQEYSDDAEGAVFDCGPPPKEGKVQANGQPAPAATSNTNGKVLPRTKSEASGANNSSPDIELTEDEKGWWKSWGSEVVHTSLDGAGMFPAFGIFADLANVVVYAVEGDVVGMGTAALSAIPGVGQGVTAAKYGKKGMDAAEAAGKALSKKEGKEAAEAAAKKPKEGSGKDGGYVEGKAKGSGGKKSKEEVEKRTKELEEEGHAPQRHGGDVTDEQLVKRARTGEAPDGSKSKRGYTPTSTAFHDDELMVNSDRYLRDNHLDKAIQNSSPSVDRIKISADTGKNIGRGYEPVGKKTGLSGPLKKVDNLTEVEAWYKLDPSTGKWLTDTIYPIVGK